MAEADLERWMAALPVGEVVPAVRAALDAGTGAVLQAPPGAGKTTLVPLTLLGAPWLRGARILMLEPRRLAARAAARRMAAMLGEAPGETIGYRTRLDTRVGPNTRIEVLTEGILLRLLQADPGLEGVGLVIFDEFHERSLDADLGLALALETQRHLRDDLRLLVMSATLDPSPVAQLLGDAPVIISSGRSHPVAVRYLERPSGRLEPAVLGAIRRALAEAAGDLLVFLPGGAEIRRVARLLATDDGGDAVIIAPLYGDLPQAAQDAAISPAPPARRKIVLATSIAETSLTIEGITIVIDSGLMRAPRYEPRSGMTRLETIRVSQASAEQRRGRAGRLGPGICYRLWREPEQAQLRPFNLPEIEEADLAPLALALAQWGSADPAALAWLDQPPAPAYGEARALLRRLGALDADGRITAEGREMARLGLHPRLAHMLLVGRRWGLGRLACALAAVLSERDIVTAAPGARDADLRFRLELVQGRGETMALPSGLTLDRGALARARQSMGLFARQLKLSQEKNEASEETGRLLAQAYPDRIAQRRPGSSGQFLLANGRGAELPGSDPLAAAEFLAVADLDGERRAARIFVAAPLARTTLAADFAGQIDTAETVAWDERAGAVLARRRERLGALTLKDEPLANPPPEQVTAVLIAGIRTLGLAALPWQGEAATLRDRVLFLRRLEGEAAWPDLSDMALTATLETWLAPYLPGISRAAQLSGIDLPRALSSLLSPDQRRRLDRLAPTHLTVPSGSRLPLDYGQGDIPILAVRLQELFGARETPSVAEGRVPVLLHLLSPARRPLQVTRDLGRFWTSSYPEVRRSMRGRYPKHPWPEDPLAALPTARASRSAAR